MRLLATLGTILAVTLFAAVPAGAVIIDHFVGTPTFALSVGPGFGGGSSPSSQGPDSVAFGPATTLTNNQRSEMLTLTGSDVNSVASAIHNPKTNHTMSFSNNANTSSDLILAYTFDPADFTDGGMSNKVDLMFVSGDLAGSTVKCTLTDGTTTSSVTQVQPAGPLVQTFAFSSFNPLLNLNAITGISYEIDSVLAQDCVIDALQTSGDVPEPITMAGLLLGLGGLTHYVRKRRA